MSKWGRAQDAVYDVLFGFEAPDNRGLLSWHPGPLNDYPTEKRGDLVEQIITVVTNIMGEDTHSWTLPDSDPVGNVRRTQQAYEEQYKNNPLP